MLTLLRHTDYFKVHESIEKAPSGLQFNFWHTEMKEYRFNAENYILNPNTSALFLLTTLGIFFFYKPHKVS